MHAVFAKFHLYAQGLWAYGQRGSRKRDKLWVILGRQIEVSKSVCKVGFLFNDDEENVGVEIF